MLKDVNYLALYGSEPSSIEAVFAIFANTIELDDICRRFWFEPALSKRFSRVLAIVEHVVTRV